MKIERIGKAKMKNEADFKSQRGITLIALAITIIIIIILATVTINMAFGDNGLIKQAQLAKDLTANSMSYEEGAMTNLVAYMNILYGNSGENPDNPGGPEEPIKPTGTISFTNPNWVGDGTATVVITTDNATDELQYQINDIEDDEWISIESGKTISGLQHNDTVYGRLWNGTEGTDPASTSILDETPPKVEIITSNLAYNSVTLNVTASDGQSGIADSETYTYYLGDVEQVSNTTNSYNYTGLRAQTQYTLKVVVKDRAGKTTEKTTTVTTLEATVGNVLTAGDYVYYLDETGVTRKCAVLYDNSSGYGVQIIPMETVEDVTLGDDNNFTTSMNSYNSAISTLNNATSKYLNTTYASSVRCVGSVPNDSDYDGAGMFTSSYSYMLNYNGHFKNTDNNYLTDWNQMNIHNIYNIGTNYWLASRYVYSDSSNSVFFLRLVSSDGGLSDRYLCTVASGGYAYSVSQILGLRPVFTLKPNIKITGGTGEEGDPYTLGV